MTNFAALNNNGMTGTKNNIFNQLIEETVGLSVDSIKQQSSDNIQRHIESRKNISMELGLGKYASMYRGNMLLAMGKINNDINTKYDAVFK